MRFFLSKTNTGFIHWDSVFLNFNKLNKIKYFIFRNGKETMNNVSSI